MLSFNTCPGCGKDISRWTEYRIFLFNRIRCPRCRARIACQFSQNYFIVHYAIIVIGMGCFTALLNSQYDSLEEIFGVWTFPLSLGMAYSALMALSVVHFFVFRKRNSIVLADQSRRLWTEEHLAFDENGIPYTKA